MFDMSRIYTLLKSSGMVMAAASAGGLLDSRGFDSADRVDSRNPRLYRGEEISADRGSSLHDEKSLGRLPCIGTENVIVKHKTCDE